MHLDDIDAATESGSAHCEGYVGVNANKVMAAYLYLIGQEARPAAKTTASLIASEDRSLAIGCGHEAGGRQGCAAASAQSPARKAKRLDFEGADAGGDRAVITYTSLGLDLIPGVPRRAGM